MLLYLHEQQNLEGYIIRRNEITGICHKDKIDPFSCCDHYARNFEDGNFLAPLNIRHQIQRNFYQPDVLRKQRFDRVESKMQWEKLPVESSFWDYLI